MKKQLKYTPEKLTEEERKAIRKQLRRESLSDALLSILAVLAAFVMLAVVTCILW